MSALYGIKIVVPYGANAGVVYIGKGIFLGSDTTGVRYKGTYTEQGGRMKFSGAMSIPAGATVFGVQQMPQGGEYSFVADLPTNFTDGAHPIAVDGKTAQVSLAKVGDIP
jgi:hypothetical protein